MFQLKRGSTYLKCMLVTAFVLVLPALAAGATYYVDAATGSDGDTGTSPGTAWKTLTHAAATVPAGTSGTPNLIMVYAGVYDAGNGETFAINFTQDYVSLTGAGTGSTFIDAGGAATALNIDAAGFAISGFAFENATTALNISKSGFSVTGCLFETTVDYGVEAAEIAPDLTSDFTYDAVAVTNNTFKTNQTGVGIHALIDSDNLTENLTVVVGDVTITGNSFPLAGGTGVFGPFFHIQEFYNSTVTTGDVTVSNNTFTGGDSGYNFFSMIMFMDDCQVTVGSLTVSGNTFTDIDNPAININDWQKMFLNGNTATVFGDLTISNNTVSISDYPSFPNSSGIQITDGFCLNIYDEASITTGMTSVTNNTVNISDVAFVKNSIIVINLGEEYWDDQVMVNLGPINVSGNSFASNDMQAVYFVSADIGRDVYGRSAVSLGPLTFSNNTVVAETESLFFAFTSVGRDMYENSSLAVNSITINGNTMTTNTGNAVTFLIDSSGYQMDGNASVTFAPLNISSNTLTAGNGDALSYHFNALGNTLFDNAACTMSPVTMDNNIMIATDGIGINTHFSSGTLASYLQDNARATLPDWIITNNSIDVTGGYPGIHLYSDENPSENYGHSQATFGSVLIDNNVFNPNKDAGMDFGIRLYHEDVGSYIYGPSMTAYGPTTITNNRFNAITSYGVYIEYDYIGYDLTGNPSLSIGAIEITDNIIDTADWGVYADITDLQTMDAANVDFGSLNIEDNTLTGITSSGINVEYGTTNHDPGFATLTVDPPTLKGNTLTGNTTTGTGIDLQVDNATSGITFSTPNIMGNAVTGFDYGIRLDTVDEATLTCNYLENNGNVGLQIVADGTFALTMNSFVDNTVNGLSITDGYPAVITAENNWWGDKLGPAACATCNGIYPGDMGTVDYDPWLTYQPQKSRCGVAFPWVMFAPATTGMGPAMP